MAKVALTSGMTLPDVVTEAVRAAGDAWLAADGERATLRELVAGADALAESLRAAGIGPGERVGLRLPNGVRYCEAFLAVVRLGAVVVPLDEELPAGGLEAVTRAVPVAAILSSADGRDVDIGPAPACDGRAGPAGGAGSPGPEDAAAVFFTSGTTGEPKPVTLSHRQIVRPLIALQRLHAAYFSGSPVRQAGRVVTMLRRYRGKVLGAAGRQTWLCTTPFRAMAGHQVLTGSLLLGHNLVTSRSFHPRRTLELVGTHRVNVLAGTPAVLELLLRVGDLRPYDLSSLLVIGVGGGPAASDLVDRASVRFGCAVTVGYGSTELGGGVLATRLEDSPDSQRRTVGRPFPGTEVRIVDENGEEVAPGTRGELVCRTEGQREWLHTGDLASRGSDDAVTILGRKDDLVMRAGNNVHPSEIERVVDAHAAVERSAAVGVPYRNDQQVWVFVVPTQGFSASAEEIRATCRESLAPGKQPDRVRFVEELPVTEHGELRRHVLREDVLIRLRQEIST